ncbi:HET domain-containing protein [Colletotrichum lupini]|uniref:HET domain-containing protein n=1 Tax=Colletotrichum lupini TaxID=145971 RepID=A0A9Q8WGS6_9PEZI|nr:HET domain-containing protein [Colletotrichum lupini]UQC82686.1 HET domain-containing protein [Colletotrichum lupini]
MIYGEGSKAFRRLQEEISRETNDLSLFAWKGHPQGSVGSQMSRGIFARSPSEFSSCSTMQRSGTRQDSPGEFTLTNKGVRFETKFPRQQPFAVHYGSDRLVGADKLPTTRNVLPNNFPDLVKDDLDWGSSQEEAFEKALLSICTNPQFQATEVEFVTKKITDGQRGFRMVKDYRATFRVELETHQDHNGIITYHASLSGKI